MVEMTKIIKAIKMLMVMVLQMVMVMVFTRMMLTVCWLQTAPLCLDFNFF